MSKAKVYLDANIFKFSATRLLRVHPREAVIDWGGRKQPLTVHDVVLVNPNDRIDDPELKRETELLPQVAAQAGRGQADFLINVETELEVWGLPKLDSETGRFYGAHYTVVDGPIQYGRIMFEAHRKYKDEQFNFLCSLKHERFDQLKRITGARQGKGKIQRNQLLDAFHLWCAEHHKCDFFLSLDFTLARMIEKSKNKPKVPVVRASELLAALQATHGH